MTNDAIRLRWSAGDRTFAAGETITIGRDILAGVRLNDDRVSRRHAELRHSADGWVLVDLGSTSGTFVGGERVRELAIRTTTTVRFGGANSPEDVIFELMTATGADAPAKPTELAAAIVLGPTILPAQPSAQRPGGPLSPRDGVVATEVADSSLQLEFGGQTMSAGPDRVVAVGRDPSNDLHTDNPTVSREHVRISHAGGRWVLEDVGTTRGTFLDGRKITRHVITGPMAFVLGPPDTGERLVVVAAGADRSGSRRWRSPRAAILLAGVACVVALVAVAAAVLLAGRKDEGADVAGLRAATVFLEAGSFTGSGSIIDGERGLILTNSHVARPDAPGQGVLYSELASDLPESIDGIVVYLSADADEPAEPAFVANVVAVDGYLDLAVLRITETIGGRLIEETEDLDLPEVEIGDSRSLDQSGTITVFGYPGISGTNSSNSVAGSVSGFVPDRRLGDNRAWINSDIRINRGDSGGLGADQSGRLVAVPTFKQLDEIDSISRLRPVHLAEDLIAAATEGETYTSPYVTPVGSEQIDPASLTLATDGQPFATSCRDRESDGRQSLENLSLMFDYTGFPAGHQDVSVAVLADGEEVGRIFAGDVYPVEWNGSGCAVVTVPLDPVPADDADLAVVIDVGPNYDRSLVPDDEES